jgi:hypothetical protein
MQLLALTSSIFGLPIDTFARDRLTRRNNGEMASEMSNGVWMFWGEREKFLLATIPRLAFQSVDEIEIGTMRLPSQLLLQPKPILWKGQISLRSMDQL